MNGEAYFYGGIGLIVLSILLFVFFQVIFYLKRKSLINSEKN